LIASKTSATEASSIEENAIMKIKTLQNEMTEKSSRADKAAQQDSGLVEEIASKKLSLDGLKVKVNVCNASLSLTSSLCAFK
jgi:hypothetical protein